MKTQKILFISYDGLTDALGQSQILAYLSNLSRPDRTFVILAFEKKENYEKNHHYVSEIVERSGIEWVKLWYHKKPPILSTVTDLRKGIKVAQQLHKQHRFDVVHCRSLLSGVIGLRIKGPKLIFDMRAWWADEKKDSGFWDKPVYKPVYHYFKSLEKKLFKQADYNISLTYAGRDEILSKKFSTEEKIGVVPTCVNLSVFEPFDPATRERVRRQLSIPLDSKVLVYSGGIGGNYDMTRMLEIFKGFLAVHPSAHILILSKDPVSEAFLHRLREAAINNYTIKSVTYREVSAYLQSGDAGMIFYKPAYSNIGRSPTKLAEYWAAGIPVISFKKIGDLELLFQRYPLGGVLCEEDLSDLEERIAALRFNVHEELRQNAIEYFGLQKGIAFYDKVYEKLRT